MITSPSGLQYEDTVTGSGATAARGAQVSVHYTGWLYTDGVNEAMDSKGIEFGEERVEEELAKHAPNGPKAVIGGIILDLEHFLKGRRSHDDITLIAIQKTA